MYVHARRRALSTVVVIGQLGLVLAVSVDQGRAQSEGPSKKPRQAAQAKATGVEVEEIVVTARKREERVQEVPIAVTAITPEVLDTLKPQDLSDLSGLAPNVEIKNNAYGPRSSNIYIRGLGYNDVEKTQSPSVGLMVDGVIMGVTVGQILDTFDIQQVEVDRGPQGLFEGKNATGGLIKVTRSRPTMDWGFKGSVGYGEYNDTLVHSIVNVPLIKDVVGGKIGVAYRNRDGYFDNLYTHHDQGAAESVDLTSALLVKPRLPGSAGDLFRDLEALVIFDYTRDRSDITNPLQFADSLSGSVSGLPANPNHLGAHEIMSDFPEHSHLDFFRGSGDVRFDTPIGRGTSITGYLNSWDDQWQDFDGSCGTDVQGRGCNFLHPVNFFLPILHTKRDSSYWQFTQELHLDSDLSKNALIGQIPGQINLLTGIYLYKHRSRLREYSSAATDATRPLQTYVPDLVFQYAVETDKSYAPFLNLTWKEQFDMPFLYSLSASAGTRYVYEEKDYNTQFRLPPFGDPIIVPASGVGRVFESKDWDKWLTRIDLSYGITEYNSFYFNRADGFRSGGFSIRGTLSEQAAGQPNCPNPAGCPENNFLSYEPEEVTSYEIGMKNEFFNGALSLNVAAFLMHVEGAQNSFSVVTPNYGPATNTYINNFQDEEIKGIEADVALAPPFVRGLTLTGSVGYQDASIDEALVDSRRLPVGPGGTAGSSGVTDLSGTPFINVPDYNYSITGMYRVPIGPTELVAGLTWKYTDDQAVGSLGTLADIQEGYGLLDGSLSLSWKNYAVSVYARNMTNEDYVVLSLPSVYFRSYGSPRTVNAELTVKF